MSHSALIVTSVHPPDDPRIRIKTAGTLADAGWDVTFVCRSPGPSRVDEMTVRSLDGPRIARTVKAVWVMFGSKADVVVVHDPELLVGAIPLAVVRGRNRVVFDLHEDLPRQLSTRSATPPWLRQLSSSMATAILRMTERVMTITLAEPQYGRVFAGEHVVFRNLPVPGSLPTRKADAEGVVYVGDVTRERGALLLVAAAGAADAGPLTLIGRCGSGLRRELEALASDSGVEIRMPGFLPYEEAWNLASRCLVGVSPLLDLPNYRDSLPTKVLEYRSVGLITIASDLPGGNDAMAGSDVARSFRAGSVEALTSAIRGALADPDAPRRALAESHEVRASWKWDRDRFIAFYGELVRSAR